MTAGRNLSAEEQRLWGAVMATVRPLRAVAVPKASRPIPVPKIIPPPDPRAMVLALKRQPPPPSLAAKKTATPTIPPRTEAGRSAAANTLDGGWDKRLGRGIVAPDASIDLHGHTLASAHALLDAGLARSIARGDRVLLLVTGKPPRPESERPHARGAIRAAVTDWLGASRHADHIAAVRGAHPRHGGTGALYIVLRRSRTPA